MNDKKGFLDVSILGRAYKVACDEGEREELQQAVSYLNHKMGQISKQPAKGPGGSERVAVMAALNIAHELLSAKAPGGFDIGDLQRRIETMHATLDAALASQD